jgi:hypothetical protein
MVGSVGEGRSRHRRASCARALASAWLVVGAGAGAAAGCGEAMSDVVAVWVDGASDGAGNRPVRIYAAGERDTLAIIPDIPGSSIDLLQVGVDARARGIAVSATDATVWIERGSGRRVTVSAAAAGREELVAPGFSFTRSGDGILRALEVDASLPPAWVFAPLSGPDALRVHAVGPPTVAAPAHRWVLRHAADAPVLVWAEVRETWVDGQVLVLAYPSEVGQGPVVDDLRPLARGILRAPGPVSSNLGFLVGCADGMCLSPSGRLLYTFVDDEVCDLWRWSWVEAETSQGTTLPERVSLACPGGVGVPTQLTAVLDDDLLVLDDALRLYLVDLGARRVTSLPKPGGVLVPYVVAHGHVLVVSSQQGEVARVDAEGLRMVSGVQSACLLRDGFAVSPGGAWVVQSCNGQTGTEGIDGLIQRISVLGSELYSGLPMRPIAIDDEGNALLYSVSSGDEDGVPRGLFVLTGDGQLTRVDELEPAPGRVMLPGEDGEGTPGRFAAGGPS